MLQLQFTDGNFLQLSMPDNVSLIYPNPGGAGFKPGSLEKLAQ